MILLLLVAFLFLPSDAGFANSFRVHISDILRLKCDELPFRTAYIGARCYFAVTKEANYSEASGLCSSASPGAQLSSNVPSLVFNTMMLEKTKFHVDKVSSESKSKQSICAYDSGYQCEAGEQSKIIPGKCVASTDQYNTFEGAETYCSRLGMEVPIINNELDNLMIRGAIKKFAWVRNVFDGATTKKWRAEKSFAKHKTCPIGFLSDRANLLSGAQMQNICGWNLKMSSVIEKDGYWGSCATIHQAGMGAVCVNDADNEFTVRKPCAADHKLGEESGVCEWTGPKDSCAKLIDFWNKTWFAPMPDFPKQTYNEFTFTHPRNAMNDVTVKVVVRRGCMFTGYQTGLLYGNNNWDQNAVLVENCRYGEHKIPCDLTGDLAASWMGLTRVLCYCDPTEANLNDHEPAPPPNKKCIEHHVFNEKTQSCEWKHEPKFCGELITYDGRRQMVEIPNWPTNRKYDFDHWHNATKQKEDFHTKISDVIVRQHCWFTMTQWEVHTRRTLQPVGYGKHQVASYYNGLLGSEHDGTHRVICQCIR